MGLIMAVVAVAAALMQAPMWVVMMFIIVAIITW